MENFLIDIEARERANKSNDQWKALQAFYKLKGLLLPDFITRNKRALNLLESNLIKSYQNEDHKVFNDRAEEI